MSNVVTNESAAEKEFYSSGVIFSKSTSVKEDSKGRNQLSLLLSEDETKQLTEAIAQINTLGARAKLQIHFTEDNSFFFIKEVQPKGATFTKKAGVGGGGYKPKTGGADVAAKLAAMKKQA